MSQEHPSLATRTRQLAMPVLICASLLVAAMVTLATVVPTDDGLRSVGGYTWSLTLWFLPVVVLAAWFLSRRAQTIQRPAFWTTLVILVALGFALDFFFAHTFLTFPSDEATLLPPAPALGGPVPMEEYLFYLGGFLFMLLLYIWCDEDFLVRYNVPDYRAEWGKSGRTKILEINWMVPGLAVAAIVLAWIYKETLAGGPYAGGFPGYFTYIAVVGVAPAMAFLRSTERFINWRAFSVTFLAVVLISILWEATLAAPLGWWAYRPEEMIGLIVAAWFDLPIEAVLVWLAATFTTVIVYEVVKVWQASGGGLPGFVPAGLRAQVRKRYHLPDLDIQP